MRFHKHLLGMAAVVAGLVGSTFAGTLTNVSITGSDTNPGATGDYTFTYTVETAIPDGDWAFCISTNPWDNNLGLFQHPISITVDDTPFNNDNSGVFGLLGPSGSYCRSINTGVDAGSAVSATIEDLVNPGTGSYQVYLFTYNGSIVDTLSGDYYTLQIGSIEVSSCDDLAAVNNDLSNDYVLTQDLDCSGSGNSVMIGADGNPFVGNFDGQEHIITVDINSTESYVGLFRSVNNATILSRLLYGEENNGNTTCWYCDHVAALQDAGVITVTTDLFDPLKRAFAMIMLMRTKKTSHVSVHDESSRIDIDK